MSIITGFDNTDSSSIGSKFYLGKITGQENIGSRDADGNPIPYYSSGDIGTLQSSVILQKFNEDEFKGPETAPNTAWIDFLNPVNSSDTTKTKQYSSFGFTQDVTWTIGLNDRDTEINYVTKILSHWNDFVVNFGGVDYYFKDVYFVPVRQDLYLASDNFQTILKTPDDLFNALNNIKDSTSYLTIPVSNDARFFNEVIVDGEHNLYNFSNQLVAKNYLAAQDLYSNKSFFSFDAIYNVLEGIRSKADLLIGDKALRDLSLLNSFQANTSYDNLTSGIIGNYNLITGLNLTGIHGFPTGYISGQYLKANETGLDFVTITDPVLDFTGLSDTPSDITPVKFLRGNQAGTALEFTGVKFLEDVEDRPASPITSGYLQLTNQNTLIWNPVAPGGGDVTYNFTGSEYFTGLKDTPDNYDLNKFLRSTNVGLEYVDINNSIVSFQGLSDTPSNFSANQYVKVNATADGLEYGTIPSPLVDFTELNDTPTDYTNSSGYYLRVNSSEDGVEFINISGQISSQEIAWESYLRYGDLPNASDHPGMFAHVFIDELGGNSGSAYISHNGDWVQIFPTVPNLDFTGLNDTPNDYLGHSGKYLKVSDGENGLEYANLPDPVVDFTGLTDTPASFAGQSKKYLQVNSAEDSLEFVDPLFSTGSFVGFGGASVLIGLETTQPVQGWNDRQITQLQGHSGVIGLTLNNNQITLPGGKYLINAEGGVFRSEATRIGVEFTAGDYVGQRFESRSNYAGSALSNNQGGARGSVKAVVQSNNPMTFKVVSFVGNVRAASPSDTTFEFAQTDVTVLDLGGDRDVLSITGLYDTPNSFDNSAGKFLQINNSEDGVEYSSLSGQISSQEIDWLAYSTVADLPSASDHHGMFAHVHSEGAAYMAHAGNWEKIYPVNGGSLTFTGLSDTPNFYDDGKILQSTANGLEWVDMPAGGGGGSISSDNLYQTYLDKSSNVTVFKKANSPMSPNSTVNVFEYRDSNPIYIYGGNFQSSFANNPKITIDDVLVTNTEGLIVGQDQHDSDISVITIPPIYATGHVQIQWHNSSASTQHYGGLLHYATGNDIQTIDVQGGGAGGGSSYEFCKLGINSTQYSPSNSQNWLNFNGDPLTGSADWKYLDPAANVWGVKPDKPGYYNIDAAYKIIHHSKNSLTSELHIWLYKRNINTNAATLIGYGTEFFDDSAGWNGPKVEADIQNIYLTEEEVVTVRANAYRAGTTANHQIEKNSAYTYLNVSRADIGGGGGGSSTFAGLTDTPNTLTEGSGQYLKVSDDGQTIEYVDLPAGGGGGSSNYEFCKAHIDSNVRLVDSSVQSSVNVIVDPNNLTQGSQDWTYDAGNGIIGLRPPEDGHYNIEGFVQNLGTAALNPSWATVRTKRCFIQKLDISTNTSNTISERTETKDSGNDGILTVEFNEPNVFLTTNDVIFVATQLNSSTTNTAQFPVSPGAFISLTKASGGESGGNSSTSSGGIGDNEEVISASNFGSKIPDVILLHPSNEQNDPRCYRFFGIDQGSSVILYRIDSTDKQIAFQNNSAGDFDATFTNTGHVRYTGDTTLQSIIDNGHAVYFGGGSSSSGGGGSSNYEFCKAFAAAGQTFSHQPNGDTKVNLDINNLTQGSQNWLHTDTTLNVVGIKIPQDGLYNINTNLNPNRDPFTEWQQDVLNLIGRLNVLKANGTTEVLANSAEAKTTSSVTSNGALLTVDFSLDNVDLQQGDFIYIEASAWLVQNLTQQHGIDENLSYISVTKAGSGGSGGGNSSTSNGGIGSDPGVIAKSNFSELLPDRINVPIIRSSETQERYFTFEGFFKRLVPNDMVQYEWNIGGSERFNITFKNNANGDWDQYSEINDTSNTDVDFSKIPSAITNQPTLKEFIDANRAIYLGGGGGSSGGGSSSNNIFGARIEVDSNNVVTIVSQTSDFIESINHIAPGNNFDITFKDGIFTEPPIAQFTARNKSGSVLEGAVVNSDESSGTDYANGKKITIKWELVGASSFDGNQTNGNYGADLLFIKNGDDFSLNGGGGDAGTSTGGRGNLDVLKNNLENFQHTLPDSIVVPWGSLGYEATFDLFAVRPASASTPPTNNSNWDIYYTCGRGHADGELMFTDDADGTLVQANATIDQTPGGDFEVGTLTLKWLIDNGRAFYAGGTSDSGGGSASAFSKMSFLSTDRVGHGGANFTPDSGNLATGAENWIYHDTTNNLYGLRPTSDGYYDIDVCVEVNSADGDSSSFGADVSYGTLGIIKRNVDDLTTSSMIARDWENKGYDQGANIVNRVNESYVYLTTKDVIYASYGMWVRPASQSKTWGISPVTSYISLSPSAAGGGSAGGGSSTFAGLTDTPSTLTEGSGQYLKVSNDGQTIEYVDLPAGGGAGGGSAILPSGSILQKVSKDVGTVNQVAGVGTKFAELDITPKAADSILICSINFTFSESQNGSRQVGNFYINDDTRTDVAAPNAGWDFATAQDNGNRHTISHVREFNAIDTSIKTIDNRLITDQTNPADYRSVYITVEEIAQSDYALAGGGGSSTFSASSYQENILQGHLATDNDANLNDLHFTGLETGAYYRLGGQARFVAGYYNAGTNMWLYAYQDSFATDNIVAALNNRAGGDADPVNATHTFNHIFQATGDLFFGVGGMDSSQDRYIYGNGNKDQTYVQLEKLGGSSNGDGGSSTFAGLTDTPSTLIEGSGQYLKVSDDGQTIEYVDLPAGSVGGIGDSAEVINLSNFGSKIPDIIQIANPSNQTPISYQFRHIDAGAMQFYDVGGNSERIRFNNDISGTYLDDNISAYSRYAGDTTLQSIIDNGHAIYLGGGGGTSLTNNIDSVVTKKENGPIDKRSTDTTASSTNYYRVPVQSLRFNDLEVGVTYRISVSARGHHAGGDLGADLVVYNRADSFSTDINMNATQLSTFNNNGGDPENPPRIISIHSVGNDATAYGESLFQSKIFEATGTHLEVLASSVSLNSYLSSIEIQLEKITVGGGGGGGSTDGGFIHAVFDGNANIVSKSSEWDTYVNNITFPQGSWNGYAQVNYKNSFTQLPTVLTTAGHVSPNHFFSQVHDQQLTHTAIITSIRGGSAGSSQQAAPFSVTIFSDEIAGGGGGGSSLSHGLGVIGYGSVDGGTATFAHKSDNVQSVTRSAAGRYTITLNTALTNYNIQVNTGGTTIASAFITNKSNNSFDVVTRRLDHANTAIEDVDTHFEFTLVNEDAIIGGGGAGGGSSTSSEVHTIQGEWIGSLNGTQPAFDNLTSGAQYLIGGTVGFGGDMSNLRVQLLSGTIGYGLNNSFSLAAAGEASYDFSHIASFSQIITATGSRHELEFESIGTVTSSVVADYSLYAKRV